MSTTSYSIFGLPTSLLLLVHLYILEYPYVNRPEYDHDVFNFNKRGLKERTKSMEDISYFLVGRVEGGKDKAKMILAKYPCVQPSDTVAFRTSLSKYLENLRHQSIYPSSAKASGGRKNADTEAWWWKDVMVRKSLLEECSGEKFERLLLSLSTHALMRNTSPIPMDNTKSLFRTQPFLYTEMLTKFHAIRHGWSRSAAELTQRQNRLAIFRAEVSAGNGIKESKYQSLPIERLQSLALSRMQNLLDEHWKGEDGRNALSLFMELSGVKIASERHSSGHDRLGKTKPTKAPPPPSPLPIAAAHHPSHLKKFRRPILPSNSTSECPVIEKARPHAQVILSNHLATAKRMRAALVEAFASTRTKQAQLEQALKTLDQSRALPVGGGSMKFWTTPNDFLGSLVTRPLPTAEVLSSLSLPVPENEVDIEQRIETIRDSILPPYPHPSDPCAPRLMPAELISRPRPRHRPSAPIATKVSGESLQMESTPSLKPTQLLTPAPSNRSIKRKSIRFSMARKARPSIFKVFDSEAEVSRLVDGTEEHSMDEDEDSDPPFKTPRVKVKPNRIWTAGSAKPSRSPLKTQTPRPSFPMAALFVEPAESLPSLMSSTSSSFFGGEGSSAQDDVDDGWGLGGIDATPMPLRRPTTRISNVSDGGSGSADALGTNSDDDLDDNSRSVTLREILLSADASQFDLLEEMEEEEGIVLATDTSFVWE